MKATAVIKFIKQKSAAKCSTAKYILLDSFLAISAISAIIITLLQAVKFEFYASIIYSSVIIFIILFSTLILKSYIKIRLSSDVINKICSDKNIPEYTPKLFSIATLCFTKISAFSAVIFPAALSAEKAYRILLSAVGKADAAKELFKSAEFTALSVFLVILCFCVTELLAASEICFAMEKDCTARYAILFSVKIMAKNIEEFIRLKFICFLLTLNFGTAAKAKTVYLYILCISEKEKRKCNGCNKKHNRNNSEYRKTSVA